MDSNPIDRTRRSVSANAVLGILFSAYLLLRLSFVWSHPPVEFNDTATYTGTYRGVRVECDNSFWTGIRPPTVPSIFRVFKGDYFRISIFQTFLSVVSWGFLALTVTWSSRTQAMRLVAFVSVLLFSMTPSVLYWDMAMLSESIALSLQALLLGVSFWLLGGWDRRKFAVLVMVAIPWVFVRDTNAWLLLLMVPFVFVAALFGMPKRFALAIAILIMTLFLGSNYLCARSLRWAGPFMNVLTERILIDQEFTDYFRRRGLPITEDLLQTAGQLHPPEMHTEERFERIRAWVFEEGYRTYSRFLLAHPRYLFFEPFSDLRSSLGQSGLTTGEFEKAGYTPLLPATVGETLSGDRFAQGWVYLAALIAGFSLPLGLRRKRYDLLLATVLIGASFPHAIICWHGDAMEVARHTLLAAVQLRMGLLMALAIVADIGLDSISRPNPTRESPERV